MGNDMKFLINIDDSLNMSNYKMFLYRLISKGQLHINNVSSLTTSLQTSFGNALDEIRTYCNRHPYQVGNLHLILSMKLSCLESSDFTESLLFRLLQIKHLLSEKKLINANSNVCIMLLYELDMFDGLRDIKAYFESKRFESDCRLLCMSLGIDIAQLDKSSDNICDVATKSQRSSGYEFIDRIFENFIDHSASTSRLIEKPDDYICDGKSWNSLSSLMLYIRQLLNDCMILEQAFNKNEQKEVILSRLRIVEYINSDFTSHDTESISATSKRVWKKIISDEELQRRYSVMLIKYNNNLRYAEDKVNHISAAYGYEQSDDISLNIPDDHAVSPGLKEPHSFESAGNSFIEKLKKFSDTKYDTDTMKTDWDNLYQEISGEIDNIELELEHRAGIISREYLSELNKRKKSVSAWDVKSLSTGNINSQRERIITEKDELNRRLCNTESKPELRFTDEINASNSLRQANYDMGVCIDCMKNTKAAQFLLFVFLMIAFVAGHYALLQPFVFKKMNSLIGWLSYVGIVLLFALTSWRAPYWYYRRRMKQTIKKLCDDLTKYISGYKKKIDNFTGYINCLNKLDYVNRYGDVLEKEYSVRMQNNTLLLWHKGCIKDHLNKLKYFEDMMNSADVSLVNCGISGEGSMEFISMNYRLDIVDCPIYWPQA